MKKLPILAILGMIILGFSMNNERSPISFMYPYTIIFFSIILFTYFAVKQKNIARIHGKKSTIFFILAFALVFKIILAPKIEGFSSDVSCFISWAYSAANDLPNFYNSGIFCDYPPLYIIVLAVMAKIANFFNLGFESGGYLLLIKMPSIIADSVTAYLLYREAKERFSEEICVLIAAAYAFNPAILLDSTLWGQVDSFFIMIIVAALVFIKKKNIRLTTIFFVLAVLMKPQGIIFLPILFFELVNRKQLINFAYAFLYAILTVVAVILPFSRNKSPLWIVELYMNTASGYKYATLNAFNFFGLLGANAVDDSTKLFIFSYKTWGLIFIILVTLYVGFLFYKTKKLYVFVISALVIITGVFVLSSRMHERYMIPAIAISLLSYIYIKDKRLLYVFVGLSITNLFNIYDVLNRMMLLNYPHVPAEDPFLLICSFANVAIFIYLIWISWDIIVKSNLTVEEFSEKAIRNSKPYVIKSDIILPNVEERKFTKIDGVLLVSMTLVYLVLSLIRLGNASSPETYWTPKTEGESFVMDFNETVDLSRITYYCALGDGWYANGEYKLEYFDGTDFKELGIIKKENVFCWEYFDTNITTNKLRLTVNIPGGAIGELGFYGNDKQKLTKILEISDKSDFIGDIEKLFDEQDRVEYHGNYLNGTYFDEIYFARTAYEFINDITPYETTHPPLGKVLILLGIQLFGMNPFGWRIIGTLFGALMIPIMYVLGKKIFGKTFLAFCLGFLMMFDFMHFTQTRIATIDSFATVFIILMYYFMYDYFVNQAQGANYKKSLKTLLFCGIFFGLGVATKWIALYTGAGLAILFFASIALKHKDLKSILASKETVKTILWCVVFFVGIPLIIYGLAYIPFISASDGNNWLKIILDSQKQMYDYHSNLNATHPFSSAWWEWPIIRRPVWYYAGQALELGRSSTIAALGNPAIWWVGIVTTVLSGILAYIRKDKRMLVVFVAIFFQYMPWVMVSRITFIYHFFSTIPFVMISIVYVIQWILEKNPKSRIYVCGYLLLVLIFFVMFYPVLSGLEVSSEYIEDLKWFKSWVF